MLNDFNCHCPVYIACGYTDLRRGIDGLAGMVMTQFHMDPFQTALFLFCGRRKDRIKALYWEGGWLSSLVQAFGKQQFSVATQHGRGTIADTPAVPLADGRTEKRTTKSHEKSFRAEHDLIAKNH